MKTIFILAGSLSSLMLSVALRATPMQGTIDFSSISGKEVSLTGGTTFGTATGLKFPVGLNMAVDGATEDFSGELGVKGTFFDFTFGAAKPGLWTLSDGNFSFDLDAGSVKTSGAHFLVLDGVGVIHDLKTGLEDTAGTFTLTTQGTPQKNGVIFSWSATDTTIPETGSTALLLSLALVGIWKSRSYLNSTVS